MSGAEVIREQAEGVLAALKAKYADEMRFYSGCEPKLVEGWDYPESGPVALAIVWEEGPHEWALRFPCGGFPEFGGEEPPVEVPKGAWVEAQTPWAVAVYPTDWMRQWPSPAPLRPGGGLLCAAKSGNVAWDGTQSESPDDGRA